MVTYADICLDKSKQLINYIHQYEKHTFTNAHLRCVFNTGKYCLSSSILIFNVTLVNTIYFCRKNDSCRLREIK